MGIEIINPKEIALKEKKRTVVMNTRKLHAWVHYYPNPGDHDELHCHNEDQVFTCFEGECTCGSPTAARPCSSPAWRRSSPAARSISSSIAATGHMILMGHRSGNQDNVMIIDYVTRQDIRKNGGPKIRNSRAGATSETPAERWGPCRRLAKCSVMRSL